MRCYLLVESMIGSIRSHLDGAARLDAIWKFSAGHAGALVSVRSERGSTEDPYGRNPRHRRPLYALQQDYLRESGWHFGSVSLSLRVKQQPWVGGTAAAERWPQFLDALPTLATIIEADV